MANHDLSHAETAASAESRLSIRFFLQTLLAVGLLILVPIWSLYIAPNILKLSEDFSFTADVISIDDFYDEGRGQYSGGVYSATEYSYETVGFEDGVQMIVNRFSVATPEGTSIFAVERTYGIDPVTRMHRPTYGDRTRDGHLFAPRGLRRGESFTYWHINYNGPATMQFISSEQLHGLEVFVYETTYEGVTIDQTEELSHLPEVGETRGVVLEPHLTLWIEPVTGRLVKYTDDTTAYFYNLETGERSHPWNHFTNTFTEQSVKQHINEAGWEKTKVQAILYYVPALVCIFALAFLGHVFGIWRWFSQRVSLNHITVVSGVIIISTATLSLVGWFAHIESLTRVVPYASAMNPLTGVCFVILGIGIILSLYAPRVATLTGALLVIVGTTRLVGIYVPSFTQSDLLILGETVLASDVPARMAVYTALVFVLLGSVLVMVRSTLLRRLRIPEVLSWIGIMLSLFALTGFFFGSIDLIALPLFFSAAVHTAALFLLASVVMYMLFREKHVLQFIGWLTVSSVLFLTLLLSILITGLIENNIRNEAQTNFLLEADRATTQIVDRLGIYINALEGGRGLFASSDEVERDEWHAYISNLGIQENYPGIQGIGYSVFVTPDERDAHVERIREEGFPEYTIRPEGERSLYSAIVYLEPFDERNRQAFGFDMYQETVRRTGMEQARDTGQPRLSGKITLVQEIDEDVQPGFLIYVPYYGHDFIGTTLEERRQSIIGYVYSAFRARNFFEGVLGASGISDVGLAVYDGTSQSPDSELYNDIEGKVADTAYARFTDTKTVQVAGRSWTFHFVSTEKYGQTFFSQLIPLIIILVGIAVSVLITVISYVLISSRQRAVLYANEVTRDLRISKAKDEAILAGLGEGLVAIDPQGIITLVNPAFESLLGWTKEEVVGKKLADIVPMVSEEGTPVVEAKRPVAQALKKGKIIQSSGEIKYQRKDATSFPVSITVSPIQGEQGFVGAVEVFRDVSKEAAIDRAKTEFVSLASHQLRTPLTAIGWNTELLLSDYKKGLTKKQRDLLKEISDGNKRMVELVNALLNISRIELGSFSITPVPVAIADVAEGVLKELAVTTKAKRLKVQTSIPKNLPAFAADKMLLRIIFQNLISNAVKYTPDNGTITVRVTKKEKKISIVIADTGYGVPKEEQSKLFEKFYRAQNVTQKSIEGTGLGLYMVKSIVEASGGTIAFTSVEGKGTEFIVSYPEKGMVAKKGTRSLS